jgi:hypothetical protein
VTVVVALREHAVGMASAETITTAKSCFEGSANIGHQGFGRINQAALPGTAKTIHGAGM